MEHRHHRLLAVFAFAILFALLSAGSVSAAGFALIEQSVSGLGTAFSGGAAIAEDASTIYYNPAGLTRLSGPQVISGVHVIVPYAQFHNQGSYYMALPGHPLIAGNDGGDAGGAVPIPNFYFSTRINDRLYAGLGINAPFGLQTNYDSGWVGRYHALKSDLMTININPSVAYKVTDQLSVGAGVSAQYIKATLTNAVDFTTIMTGILHAYSPQPDGFASLTGDSWGYGYNFGLLYEFTPQTRAGLAFRSKVKQKLTGDVTFAGVPGFITSNTPLFQNCSISAFLDLPASASASFVHQFNSQWTVMADITWTQWDSFNELRIKFANPYQPDSVVTTDWRNTFRYSIGAQYAPVDRLTLKTGIAYDQTPIRSAQYRTPRIPDNSRFWTAVGVNYKVSNSVSVDAGYAHLFVADPSTNKADPVEDVTRGALQGYWDANVNIASVQVKVLF
ncbi:MAG TPA: outer membrane protein transport protein [Dissulfurispiraceae bacterium]|nr:outer membrane protein transport protein [Dissulfurispiraceae bacterium]